MAGDRRDGEKRSSRFRKSFSGKAPFFPLAHVGHRRAFRGRERRPGAVDREARGERGTRAAPGSTRGEARGAASSERREPAGAHPSSSGWRPRRPSPALRKERAFPLAHVGHPGKFLPRARSGPRGSVVAHVGHLGKYLPRARGVPRGSLLAHVGHLGKFLPRARSEPRGSFLAHVGQPGQSPLEKSLARAR